VDLTTLIPPEHLAVPLEAADVTAAVEQLVQRLVESGAARPSVALPGGRFEPLRNVIALSEDVILPHFRSAAVDRLAIALGVARQPLPPGDSGLDIRPRIVALVLAPADAAGQYLQATSSLARLLRDPEVVELLVRQDSAEDLLALPQLRALPVEARLAVRDVMAHRVHSVPPSATLAEAINLMMRRRLRALPVVGAKGEVLGMVTDADLMRALMPQIPRAASDDPGDSAILDRPVREIMTRSVLCVSDDMGLSDVANIMVHKDVEQVPVVHAGTIAGIVSRGDIIRKLFSRH
jgi:CBS domain-containing protein/mannitol/fructose-specific phosphotransferase system IIA component (Ntr-type)